MMTFGAIILDIVIFVIAISIGLFMLADSGEIKDFLITISIGIIVVILVIIGQFFYYSNFESGKRAIKTQKSEIQGGIERQVNVYSMNGNLIKTYKGKFDVEYDDNRIMFDDEKGKRHIVYYPTGTITIDEINGDDNN